MVVVMIARVNAQNARTTACAGRDSTACVIVVWAATCVIVVWAATDSTAHNGHRA